MTPERIDELRAIEGSVLEYREDGDDQNYADRSEDWKEMLDEIERMQATLTRIAAVCNYIVDGFDASDPYDRGSSVVAAQMLGIIRQQRTGDDQ